MKLKACFSVVVLPVLLLVICSDGVGQRHKKKPKHKVTIHKMNKLPTGMWGGQHVELEVNERGATVEYDCGRGTIAQPLMIDSQGRFEVVGKHILEHGGPERVGPSSDNSDTHPARYVGSVSGTTMTLTVTLTDTREEIGTFMLTHGKASRLVKCK